MFITEHYIEHKAVTKGRKRVFQAGMPLANRPTVKRRFTYKELTLIIGVFVAMIIAITLWAQDGSDQYSRTTFAPAVERVIPVIGSLVKSVLFHF